MKNKRFCLETLAPYDLQGIEARLSRMAAMGWQLESAGYLLWRYRKAEPARVHYAVVRVPKRRDGGDRKDPFPSQESYGPAGWEFVSNLFHGQNRGRDLLQIFRNDAVAPVPLETDEELRLRCLHRAMRRTYCFYGWWQLVFAFLCELLPLYHLRYRMPQVLFLHGNNLLFYFAFLLCLLLFALLRNGAYLLWYLRSRLSVRSGGEPVRVSRVYSILRFLSMFLLVVLALFLTSNQNEAVLVLRLGVLSLGALGLTLLTQYEERWKLDSGLQTAVTLLCVILIVLSFGRVPRDPFREAARRMEVPEGAYRWEGSLWDEAPQAFPLTAEDLTGRPWSHIRRTHEERGSFLARESLYQETASQESGESYRLQYSLIRTDTPWVYDWLKASYLECPGQWYQPEDPAPWGAESAYRLCAEKHSPEQRLVFGPGYIITLESPDSLTPEQAALAASRLRAELEKEEQP